MKRLPTIVAATLALIVSAPLLSAGTAPAAAQGRHDDEGGGRLRERLRDRFQDRREQCATSSWISLTSGRL